MYMCVVYVHDLTCLEGLDGYLCCLVPHSFPHLAKVPLAQFTVELESPPLNLPLISVRVGGGGVGVCRVRVRVRGVEGGGVGCVG